MSKVYIAADHAGFALKQVLIPYIESLGHSVTDCGANTFSEGDDYPDFVVPCAVRVAEDKGSYGVVIGASGQGEAMAANRIPGVRAAVYYGANARTQTDSNGRVLTIVASSRMHNNANVLSLGARFLTVQEAQEGVQCFLETSFSLGEQHIRRIDKLG